MKTLSLLIFITTITYIQSSGDLSVPVVVGRSYTVTTDYGDVKDTEGIKRSLISENDTNKWQYFYFCDRAKGGNKKKCGAWVDEKGQKIKGANNNVKRTEEGGEISKMQIKDSGSYIRIGEYPGTVHAYSEGVKVFVQEGPKA